jgi:hypothetical protein
MSSFLIKDIERDSVTVLTPHGESKVIRVKGVQNISEINQGDEITPYLHKDRSIHLVTDSLLLAEYTSASIEVVRELPNSSLTLTYAVKEGRILDNPTAHVENHNLSDDLESQTTLSSTQMSSSPKTVWSLASDKIRKPPGASAYDPESEIDFPPLGSRSVSDSSASTSHTASVSSPVDLPEDFSDFPPLMSGAKVGLQKPIGKVDRTLAAEAGARTELERVAADAKEGFVTVRSVKNQRLEDLRLANLEEAVKAGEEFRQHLIDTGNSLPDEGKKPRKKAEAASRTKERKERSEYRFGRGMLG